MQSYDIYENNIVIRKMKMEEYPLLKEFLYEAIFLPPGVTAPPKSVLLLPELQVYIKDFGKDRRDLALVAEYKNKIVGAVWARRMKDYGFVNENTPSLAISLWQEFRGKGIGTRMLNNLFCFLIEQGEDRVSLSVQKENPAVRLYQRLGFWTVKETSEEYIMIKSL